MAWGDGTGDTFAVTPGGRAFDVAHKDKVMTAIMAEYGNDVATQAKLRPLGAIPRMPRQLSSSRVVKTPADLKGFKIRVPASNNHIQNWFDAIKTRQRPIADVEIGHRSAVICHLGNIAMLLNRSQGWIGKVRDQVAAEADNGYISRNSATAEFHHFHCRRCRQVVDGNEIEVVAAGLLGSPEDVAADTAEAVQYDILGLRQRFLFLPSRTRWLQPAGYSAPRTRGPRAPVAMGRLPGRRARCSLASQANARAST